MKQPDENTAFKDAQHNSNGFCGNMSHSCHENQELVNKLEQSRQYGEVDSQEADRIYRGQTLGGW